MSALLSLVQWLSPAFPTGAFAYSHGLERAVECGTVHDTGSLQHWLRGVLEFGAGWQDAVLLAQALAPGADHAALDRIARALQPCAERLAETLEQGAAFARTISAITDTPQPPRCLPVALGQAASGLLAPTQTIALFLQSFASNLVTIGVRHVPLGQTEGQALLARLAPGLTVLAERASGAGLEDLASAALGADLAALQHETMTVRIFRT